MTDPFAPYPDPYRTPPADLRKRLVTDAVAGRATPLQWATVAYLQVGKVTKGGADAVIAEVEAECRALTGRGLPLA